jgi:hypothetical protein
MQPLQKSTSNPSAAAPRVMAMQDSYKSDSFQLQVELDYLFSSPVIAFISIETEFIQKP